MRSIEGENELLLTCAETPDGVAILRCERGTTPCACRTRSAVRRWFRSAPMRSANARPISRAARPFLCASPAAGRNPRTMQTPSARSPCRAACKAWAGMRFTTAAASSG